MSARVMFTKQIVFPLDCIFNNSLEYLSVCWFCSNSNNNNKSKLTQFSSLLILYFVVAVNVGGPRFERPGNQSKQALSNMLRMRMPTSQYMGSTGPQPQPSMAPFPNIQRQQFIRSLFVTLFLFQPILLYSLLLQLKIIGNSLFSSSFKNLDY